MELKLRIHTYYISLCINYAFYSSPIRTLVAMAIYIFHTFIKGKAKIGYVFCLNGDIWNSFLQKCLLRSPLCFIWLLSKLLNLIGYQGNKKVYFRIFHIQHHKVEEVNTLHTCL